MRPIRIYQVVAGVAREKHPGVGRYPFWIITLAAGVNVELVFN